MDFKRNRGTCHLTIKSLEGKIVGRSTERVRTRTRLKIVHGKITGEMNGNNVRMKKELENWLSLEGTGVEYKGEIDQSGNKAIGTFTAGKTTGNWSVERNK